jgi:hypothetical protein
MSILQPHHWGFPDSHIIKPFIGDTITYEEPTIMLELKIEPRIENCAIDILCVHHKNPPFGP